MNMLRGGVLVIGFMGMTLFGAAPTGRAAWGPPSTLTSESSSIRSMMHQSPAGKPACIIPDKGIIYYVPYAEAEPFPWTVEAEKREFLKQAVIESGLGPVHNQAGNVFHVSDAWARRLQREAKGAPVKLYYVLEGDDSRTLMTCPNQSLLRGIIKDAGCRRVPHHAATVFYVEKDDKDVLLGAESSEMPLAYIVEGDPFETVVQEQRCGSILVESLMKRFGTIRGENTGLIKMAIRASGSRHVVGYVEPNVFYITSEAAVHLGEKVRKDVDKASGKILYVIPQGEDLLIKRKLFEPPYEITFPRFVYYCSNQELVKQAAIASNQGTIRMFSEWPDGKMADECVSEDIFYVTPEWMKRLCDAGATKVDHRKHVESLSGSSCSIQ